MKTIKSLLVVFIFINSSISLQAQSGFNVEQYKTFLQSHQNLTSEGLMKMHDAGTFTGNIKLNYNSARYFDSIAIKYNLTEAEKSNIQQYGFMVTERLPKAAFGDAYLDIFRNDLPVFVSSDAILHAFHISYDRILKDVELGVIIDSLKNMLTKMHDNISVLNTKYSANTDMKQMLLDADVYITMAGSLLGLSISPYYSENTSKINELLLLIKSADGISNYSLFTTTPVAYDWSQFKPRGHYDDNARPVLANYFRAMIWLGRTEMYLLNPDAFSPADEQTKYLDVRRGTIDAMLIKELFDNSQVSTTYNYIENLLQFFVGEQDNVTIDNLGYLKNAVSLTSADQLLDSLKLVTFQDTLKNQSFANQLILSQLLEHDPYKPDSIVPASAFLLFGQRFIIDSYITSQVVYDRIAACRMLPSMLDPMAALGNDGAIQLLKDELDQYNYSGNLASLRYLIDSYGTDFWQGSMYNGWLNSIRSLNQPADRSGLPAFMQTGAYWQEKLNTQLASWAELRHDNLLYAKQSYSGMASCSFPYTYLEPFPELYKCIKNIALMGKEKFANTNASSSFLLYQISNYFDYLYTVCDTLISISQKELNKQQFSDDDISFLKRIVYNNDKGCDLPPYSGWYANLFYSDPLYGYKGILTQDNIVADVHTAPTDCGGSKVGWVKHVGTGPVNLGVFAAELPDGNLTAFIGPVSSYYEYTSTNFLRLTDQEWNSTYLASSLRPTWVNTYLLDSGGKAKAEGLKLVTSVDKSGQSGQVINNNIVMANYPNPFNPVTTISYSIPQSLTNSMVELTIYNIQGQVVKHLLHKNMQAGNYLTRWDGTNDSGVNVASGTYICNIKAGSMQKAGKILLLK